MAFVLLAARLLLAAVFLVAGLAKLADLAGSRKAMRDFGVPAQLATPLGSLLPLGELVVTFGWSTSSLDTDARNRTFSATVPTVLVSSL